MCLIIDDLNHVTATKRHGLEVFFVIFRGIKIAEFLSLGAANSKLITLLAKV